MGTLCSSNLISASVLQHFMVYEVLSHLLCHWIDCKQSACSTNEETTGGWPLPPTLMGHWFLLGSIPGKQIVPAVTPWMLLLFSFQHGNLSHDFVSLIGQRNIVDLQFV